MASRTASGAAVEEIKYLREGAAKLWAPVSKPELGFHHPDSAVKTSLLSVCGESVLPERSGSLLSFWKEASTGMKNDV